MTRTPVGGFSTTYTLTRNSWPQYDIGTIFLSFKYEYTGLVYTLQHLVFTDGSTVCMWILLIFWSRLLFWLEEVECFTQPLYIKFKTRNFSKLSKLYNDCVRCSRVTSNVNRLQARGTNNNIPGSSSAPPESSSPAVIIPAFPPKSLFLKLSAKQLEQRRLRLQSWLQALTQLPPNHSAKQQLQNFLW